MRNPAQSGTSTTRSEAEGVHIVHPLFLARFGASSRAAETAARAGRDLAPI